MMKLEFDPGLIEEVVFMAIREKEEQGDTKLSEEYHLRVDPIYEDFSLEERPIQFRKVEWDFFHKLGFVALVEKALDEFKELEDLMAGAVIVKAKSKHDEGSDLVSDLNRKNAKKRMKVKLLAERFRDHIFLEKFLRHEIMHILDMLSDAFGYRSEFLGGNPMEQCIVTERYSTFWDIYVDSRILKDGKETIGSRESRFEEFSALYMGFSEEGKKAIFDVLWNDENLTHGKILELADDVNKVLRLSDDKIPENLRQKKKILLPGALCPLCQFRTYKWVENLEEDIETVQDIRQDFPNWSAEDGACDRCVEMYKSRKAISHHII
ncbi:hypothetical protein KsCSTR_07990 [Candidatus Kuenenia stuttgartiensis]|uniref:Uncharacterized protein n=1 Tax=Kuenenia stuttgartiensis TaxID=174633 RepID=A0A6G7GKR9_KUEST|nr:hypothetical protein [Candidatus Kuenenia stuttgartiensis]MCF6151005.1 hypothetical protein [Candidatus Kuenenia stuttgartiensis]QII10178.1 hypothetical protein KsCSTR_07990 [Candidatus Kuenenia stuttgartiensis]